LYQDSFEIYFTPPPLWIEPSVGSGSFSNAFKNLNLNGNLKTIDIDPNVACDECIDFLSWEFKPNEEKQIIVFGNPPFGKNASLAIKFINKSAEFANIIAFVLPLSFEKIRTLNQVDRCLHLLHSEPLENNAFTFEGQEPL
jgi:hypothetical protein